MPVFISLVFCWGVATTQCETVPVPQPVIGMAACGVAAQEAAAQMLPERRGEWLDHWLCTPGSPPPRGDRA